VSNSKDKFSFPILDFSQFPIIQNERAGPVANRIYIGSIGYVFHKKPIRLSLFDCSYKFKCQIFWVLFPFPVTQMDEL